MKKIIFFVSTIIFFGLAPDVFAQGFVPLAEIPGLTDTSALSVARSTNLASFFNNLYKYLIGVAAILAVIEIIWGGLEISTQDSVSKKSDGKQRIYNAIGGLVLILSPVLVFSIINPSILNLSLNLPELDTAPGIPGGGGRGTMLPPAPATGCTLAYSGPYLETAICASRGDASSYDCTNGLTRTIPACESTASRPGECNQSGGVSVYCGKSIVVLYQKEATGVSGILGFGDSSVIPRDAQTQSAFASSCRADGGTMDASKKISSFVTAGLVDSGCPADSGIPPSTLTANQIQLGGIICYNEVLACKP